MNKIGMLRRLLTAIIFITLPALLFAQKNNWQSLFDGKTLSGWKMIGGEGWTVKKGEIIALPFTEKGQKDLITTTEFQNFELSFEFKIFEKTNSGVKYLVHNNFPGQNGTYLGLEYQIVDDINYIYPDRGDLRTTASLYDLIPSNKIKIGPSASWNKGRIIVNNNHIEHWLNGRMVVNYDRNSPTFDSLVKLSKYKNLEMFGKNPKGLILLQNEGTPVHFRRIKINKM